MKTHLIELRRMDLIELRRMDGAKEKPYVLRFIVVPKEVIVLEGEQRKRLLKIWKSKMGTTRSMPKYLVRFDRDKILWSSVDKFSVPIWFSSPKKGVEEDELLLQRMVFVDEVKEIQDGCVEQEVSRWKLLTEL